MDLRSGSETKASSISRERRLGSSASTGRQARRNTISLTCLPKRTCAPWPPPQSAMGLRTGSSTAERGAWPRSLRGTIVAGPTPSRAHDNDCLCLPAASTSHQSEAGKKESPDHHLNPACQPCAEPSSISSFDCRLINARTADNGSAQNGSTNKSAKVVLG